MLFSLFSTITRQKLLARKFRERDGGIYLYILFPIAVAFLITFGGARLLSLFWPDFFIRIIPDVRIHHFAYGIFIMAASGYLALVNVTPKSRYLIALLHGFGLGLAFDEFGFWLYLSDSNVARWSYDGVLVLAAFFLLIISAESGLTMWKHHFSKRNRTHTPDVSVSENAPEVDPVL